MNTCCIEERWMKIDPDFSQTYDPANVDAPPCANGGVLDHETNTCACPFPWANGSDQTLEGCTKCAVAECANGGTLDLSSCECSCRVGFGGKTCESALFAKAESSAFGCAIRATLDARHDMRVDNSIVIAVKVGESGGWTPVTKPGELCAQRASALRKFTLTDFEKSDVTNAKADGTSAHGDGTSAELAGDGNSAKGDRTFVEGDRNGEKGDGTSAKGDGACPDGSVVALLDVYARGVHPMPGEEIRVRFVRSLGVNEFGVHRGYDLDYFGDAMEAFAGTCDSASMGTLSALGGMNTQGGRAVLDSKGIVAAAALLVAAACFVLVAVTRSFKRPAAGREEGEAQPLLRAVVDARGMDGGE